MYYSSYVSHSTRFIWHANCVTLSAWCITLVMSVTALISSGMKTVWHHYCDNVCDSGSACFLRCGGCVLVRQWQCVTILLAVYVSSACFLRCGSCVLVSHWQCVTILVAVYVSVACFLRCGGCVLVIDSVWPYLWQCMYLVLVSSGVEAVY